MVSDSRIERVERDEHNAAAGGRTVVRSVAAVRRAVWALDAVAAAGAMLLACTFSSTAVGPWPGAAMLPAGVFGAAFLAAAHAARLYDGRERARPSAQLLRILAVASLASAVTFGFFSLVLARPIGRDALGLAVLLCGPVVLLPRTALASLLRRRPTRVLFLGQGPLAAKLTRALSGPESPYEVVRSDGGAPKAGDALVELCRTRGVDQIVLPGDPEQLAAVLVPALQCLPLGCRIRSEVDFHEDLWSRVPVEHIGPDWMLSCGLDTSNRVAEGVKRAADVALALLVLVALAPFTLLALLAIGLSADGPLFYRQARVGRYGRTFEIWKLRTMRVGAEAGAPRWASEDDPRCTAVGRLLRRTRLDEVPQVVNVLLGEMSFVGPRPERPEFVEELEARIPYYAWRHFVRPGLTGWAQVNLPYGSTVEDARRKLEYDLYYVRHCSLLTDLLIVLRTAAAALRGAR
jgi:exopolysaccharide biosynthesis polyprenyl glycosylphosphotransferase